MNSSVENATYVNELTIYGTNVKQETICEETKKETDGDYVSV